MSTIIPVHVSMKQDNITTMSVFTRIPGQDYFAKYTGAGIPKKNVWNLSTALNTGGCIPKNALPGILSSNLFVVWSLAEQK